MKALSILQPWAWLIVNGHKDIENRTWPTEYRGRFLVHTGKSYSAAEHAEYCDIIREDFGIELPPYAQLPRGAIVGEAELVDCVEHHPSRWKDPDSWGFVLRNAKALSVPIPYRGQLSFFKVELTHFTAAVDLFGSQ